MVSYYERNTISDRAKVHFDKVRTMVLQKWTILALATSLRPISASGLGIHSDRILRLIRSNDVKPGWLTARGAATKESRVSAIGRWPDDPAGRL